LKESLLEPGVEATLDALGDRTRRMILTRLRDGPLAVVDIARGLQVSRPAVSQHLRVLKDAGLVSDSPSGNRRLYAVDPRGLAELRRFLESFWTDALGRFAEFADSLGKESHDDGSGSAS
jgi:DNA-binding transcriptional ArsR family regulator